MFLLEERDAAYPQLTFPNDGNPLVPHNPVSAPHPRIPQSSTTTFSIPHSRLLSFMFLPLTSTSVLYLGISTENLRLYSVSPALTKLSSSATCRSAT